MNFLKIATSALLVSTLLGTASQAAPEKKDVTIAVGGRVALYYLPLNIAALKGYFKDEGLNVRIADFKGGSQSVEAVVGGSADVLSSAFEHIVTMQALGRHLEGVILQGRYPGFVLSVSPELAKTWKGPSSLIGKKVGVTAPGSSTNAMLDLLLDRAGIDPKKVAVVGVGAGAGVVAAMQQHEVDAVVEADPATTLLVRKGLAKVEVDTRTLKGTEAVYGGPMPAATISVPTAFAKKNPKTVQAVVDAMAKALHYLQTATPEQILDTLPKSMLLGGADRATYLEMIKAVLPSYSPQGKFTKAAVETTLNVLDKTNAKVKAAKIDLAATYTNDFVEKALKTQ